jgi:hypothetical protein
MAINLSTLLNQLQSGTAVSATGTAVDFTGIPAGVKQITIIFNGISTNGTTSYQVQIGAGSIETTGYLSLSGNQNNNTTGESTSVNGFVVRSASPSYTTFGALNIYNISGNIWVASFAGVYYNAGTTESGGNKTVAGVLDRLRITTGNGTDTFDAGTFNIFYQ